MERHRFLGRSVRTPFETPRRQYFASRKLHPGRHRKSFLEQLEIHCRRRRQQSRGSGNSRRPTNLSTRARPGRRQSSEVARGKSSQKPAVAKPFRPVWENRPSRILSRPMHSIRFGTDGCRGIISADFTFANARIVAHAIARYVVRGEDARKGVLVGYDHRFASDTIAAAVVETISATGTPVWLADKPCPTPAISLLVRQRNAAGGIVITASHNPYNWNGIKYKASYGSSALPSIVAQIESELAFVQSSGIPPLPAQENLIKPLEPRAPYLDTLEKLVDWDRIRKANFRFVSDAMFGSAAGFLPELFRRNKIPCDEIRGVRDPRFGGIHPEPIEPHIAALREAVVTGKYDPGFA